MFHKDRLAHGLSQIGIFLLRGAGWAAVGIVVGFVVSYFFRLPGRVDTFAFTEAMLGVVITGLAIVGAFVVALQWSNLDRQMHAFDVKVRETNEFFENANTKAMEVAKNIDEYVKKTVDNYKEGTEYLQNLLEENARNANIFNANVADFDKRQKELEEKIKEFEKRENELGKIVRDSGVLMEKVEEILASQASTSD